ncbi:MAG TPA: ImmA/IrrE family metallo-endopeptidase [Solirubrobacteraceae bacterium]|jgi:Zn-dependent peptidase ImmA (M78 family)|nr:ImmA/IrrE family metallo-endopeptidase [Solirubrobacteraceae bacterium]
MGTNPEDDARQLLLAVWAPDSDGVPIPLPVDPFVIAQKLGIKAYAAGLDEGISGMLVKRAGEDPEIYVHASDSPNRRRFTCAHELGHYYKRSATGDTEWEYVEHRDLLTSAGNDAEEIYANKFAASLLMPREEVERRCTDGRAVPTLAFEFGVSEDAMRFRLVNLGLK